MAEKCTPEELAKLTDGIVKGKVGETEVTPFDIDDSPTGSVNEVLHRTKTGYLSHWRTMRGAFGDELARSAVDPIAMNEAKANNFIAKEFANYKKATKPLRKFFRGLPREQDEQLGEVLTHIDAAGNYKGPVGAFSPEVVKAGTEIRGIYNRLFKEFGIDPEKYLNFYRPIIKMKTNGIFWDEIDSPAAAQFKKMLSGEDIKFYHELERKGLVMDPDPTATAGFVSYIRGLANAKIRKPVIDEIEERVINPSFGREYIRTSDGRVHIKADDPVGNALWMEYKNHLFGGPTPLDIQLTGTLRNLVGMFGKDASVHSLYKLSHGLSSAAYAGALGSPLGGRPASVIRQLFQLVPTYAELGGKYTMQGIQKTMKPGAINSLIERNMITSPIEGLAETVGIARGAGRVISDTTEHFLKVFGAVDQFTRAATAYGAEARFLDYQARGILNKLPMDRAFRTEFDRLLKQDPTGEKAMNRYMFETVANLQYIFGKANRPEAFRGALGNLAGALMSYPMNSFEMARMFTKRALPEAYGGAGDPMPLVRLTLATAGIVMAGSEFLNADLRSAVLLGAIPHSLMFPKMAIDTFQAGRSTVEWGTGNLFNIGETDYHKHQRVQNLQNFGRDMRLFVPGGLFFFEDIPRFIDEGSAARMLALTPKAGELNEQARARAKEARQSQGATIRGVGGYRDY